MHRVEVVLAAMLLAGCAGPVPLWSGTGRPAPLFRDPALTAPEAARVLVPGQLSRPEVQERLGPAERLAFDSGYEVWVYRSREPPRGTDNPELVILFDPRGIVHKVRLRPATGQ